MTTTYTFVNAVAARLFAEWWNPIHFRQVTVNERDVSIQASAESNPGLRFAEIAGAFNAACQKAREIGEGDE